ncbi:MAG: hypothetical protein P8Y85_04360, partial [Nitrospirota bacterium]
MGLLRYVGMALEAEAVARLADTVRAPAFAQACRLMLDCKGRVVVTDLLPSELMQLLEAELTGPSPKLMTGELGILELDHGRYEPTCGGLVPKRVQEYIETEGGLGGAALLGHFGQPPYGYTPNVEQSEQVKLVLRTLYA